MHLNFHNAHIQTDTPILVKNNENPIPSESVNESQMSSVHTQTSHVIWTVFMLCFIVSLISKSLQSRVQTCYVTQVSNTNRNT